MMDLVGDPGADEEETMALVATFDAERQRESGAGGSRESREYEASQAPMTQAPSPEASDDAVETEQPAAAADESQQPAAAQPKTATTSGEDASSQQGWPGLANYVSPGASGRRVAASGGGGDDGFQAAAAAAAGGGGAAVVDESQQSAAAAAAAAGPALTRQDTLTLSDDTASQANYADAALAGCTVYIDPESYSEDEANDLTSELLTNGAKVARDLDRKYTSHLPLLVSFETTAC